MYFIKSTFNVKGFLKDDAGDYRSIGCVAATLNNSVLHKIHIPCDGIVKYFVCKQREYFFMVMFSLFLPMCTLYHFKIFYGHFFEFVNY